MGGPQPAERVPLEDPGPLSQSLIWHVQRAGYEGAGADAWRKGYVPQYVTSNPFIAAAYTRMVHRFLGETAADGHLAEPVTIVDLGAGSGQLAFHLVRALGALTRRGRPVPPVRFVLTDFNDANRAAWRDHPALAPYFADGTIVSARFDAASDTDLHIDDGGRLSPDGTGRRGVLVANYFFDVLPQDCFTVVDGTLHEVHSAASSTTAGAEVRPGDLLSQVSLDFTTVPVDPGRYGSATMNQVLEQLGGTHPSGMMLFPGVALECLERLRAIFDGGMVLLSADKGYTRPTDPGAADGPMIKEHGPTFSMMVNYDAIGRWFEVNGGIALHPPRPTRSLTLSFGAVGFDAGAVADTAAAFVDCVDGWNPDDFYELTTGLRSVGDLDVRAAQALLHLSGWDSEVLTNNLHSFTAAVSDLHPVRVAELVEALERVWDSHFAVNASDDVAVAIATLLYSIGLYDEAAGYLQQSLQLHGPTPSVLYDLAMCHIALHDHTAALGYADQAVAADPDYALSDSVRKLLEANQAGPRRP